MIRYPRRPSPLAPEPRKVGAGTESEPMWMRILAGLLGGGTGETGLDIATALTPFLGAALSKTSQMGNLMKLLSAGKKMGYVEVPRGLGSTLAKGSPEEMIEYLAGTIASGPETYLTTKTKVPISVLLRPTKDPAKVLMMPYVHPRGSMPPFGRANVPEEKWFMTKITKDLAELGQSPRTDYVRSGPYTGAHLIPFHAALRFLRKLSKYSRVFSEDLLIP